MDHLLDTHLLLWLALEPEKLSARARIILESPANRIFFSLASIWEVAIKFGLGRKDFTLHPITLRDGLVEAGFLEMLVTSKHAAGILALPRLHRDPFDRMLIAQAIAENMQLLTSDALILQYPGPILEV